MIEVENLTKMYGNFTAVRDVTFQVQKGEVVGLLGPNGAGKTTIMKMLTGFHFPTSGRASVNNYDVFDSPLSIKESLGYLPENAPLYGDLNVEEYLDFIADTRALVGSVKKERIDAVIKTCNLESVLRRDIEKLSRGFRQRVGLAQALIHDPEILILDEPTTGLDPNQILEIRKLIRELGKEKTVIISTHILQEVEAVCTRVLILNEGSIAAQGTTDEIGGELRGDDIYNLEVKGGSGESVRQKLASLPGFVSIIRLEETGSIISLQIAVKPGSGGGESIFDWAVGAGYKLPLISPEKYSLEDIFIKLTHEGGSNE
jgi:ABC-2 type transport system ATP-binding protein